MSVQEYHALRNALWKDLGSQGVIVDEFDDEAFKDFDTVLGKHLPVDWAWDEKTKINEKTYKVSIEFEYDSDEGAPLTGKPINHADDAIDAVRDELRELSANEFLIKCDVWDKEGYSHTICT